MTGVLTLSTGKLRHDKNFFTRPVVRTFWGFMYEFNRYHNEKIIYELATKVNHYHSSSE